MNYKIILSNQEKGNLYVLGDSLCDTGVLVEGGTLLLKHLMVPKTIKMLPPFYHNSFSNGKVAIQIVADNLLIDLKPAWKFNLVNIDERIGNNYAVSGALANRIWDFTVESFLMNNFDLSNQVHALTKQHHIIDKDIIFIAIGSNDILRTMKNNSFLEQETIIKETIIIVKIALKKLIELGAKCIILANLPDLSRIPLFNNKKKDKNRVLELINKFNKLLLTTTKELDKEGKIIINYDLFECMSRAMSEFKKLDDTNNIIDAALTTDFSQLIKNGVINSTFNKGISYENMDKYFFFDDVHPNKWCHNFIAQELTQLIIKRKNGN